MQMPWIDWVWIILLAGLLDAAIIVFIKIQGYLNDPARQAKNDEWFKQFKHNQSEKYKDNTLRWRVEGLSQHFHRDIPPR